MNPKPKNYALTQDKILTESELRLMLKTIRPSMEQATRDKRHLHFINDFYLILFASLTGLRVSEVCGLKIGDVGDTTLRVIGKGNKLRVVPLGKRGREMIHELLRIKVEVMKQPTDSEQRLFLNRNQKPFTRFAIERRFVYWRVRCGIKRSINFHSLRHGYATHLLNNSFLLHEVQKILGHSSPATTSQYLHFTIATQQRVDSVL